MKYKMILIPVMTTIFSACGGGGSGVSGVGGSVGGGAFHTFSSAGTVSNICRGYQAPTNQNACVNAGGNWQNGVGTTSSCSRKGNGTVDGSYNAICDYGVTSLACKLGSVNFNLVGSLSSLAMDACEGVNGDVQVSCAIGNSSDCSAVGGTWQSTANPDYCTGYDVSTAPHCEALGGIFYSSLQYVNGSMDVYTNPGHGELITGTNNVTAIWSPTDPVSIVSLNPQNPVYMTATAQIRNLGTQWQANLDMTTGDSFQQNMNQTANFILISPVPTFSGGLELISPRLYFE